MKNKMEVGIVVTLAGIFAVLTGITGCSMVAPPLNGDGHIALIADAEGMRAFGDTMNGMITNGKASPDKDTAHWQNRQVQEVERTKRITSQGFWQKLTGNEATTQTQGS